MKEKDFLRQVSDKQMPDLEKIRENIINNEEINKPKVLQLKPSRLIAVAAVTAFVIIGTVVAVASGRNGFSFFSPKPTSVATADEADYSKKTYTAKQNKSKTKSKAAKKQTSPKEKTLKKLKESGVTFSWAEPLGKVGDYELVYAGTESRVPCECDYVIDDFTFKCSDMLAPNGLGLYIVGEDKSYTLTDARKNNIIPDITEVVKLIDSKYSEIDFNFTITGNSNFANWIKQRLDRNAATLARLGTVDGFELYYNLRSDEGSGTATDTLGDLKISTDRPKRDYALGIYAADSDRCADLGEAYSNGWITNLKTLEDLIRSNTKTSKRFTFEIIENEESEPATEAETQAETEQEATAQSEPEAETETKSDNI